MRTRVLAVVAIATALVAACAPGAGSGGQLAGTEWILRSYLQEGSLAIVPETQYADATFNAERVKGFGGCNSYDAVYRAGGRTLFISQPMSTLMACDEEAMAFEAAYLALLDGSRFYTARRDTLTIYDANRQTILVFDAAPRNPLLGTWRVDSFETAPGTVSAVLDGTQLEVVFGIGSVGGNAGCNTFTGTYGTNGNVVRVGRLATTLMACAEYVMAQETAFLAALEGASLIDQRAESLNLTDLSGSLTVALVRPAPEATAGPSVSPATSPTAEPTEKPTPKPTEKPTPRPTATPTASPTATPTPRPTEPPTASPAPAPSASPAVAACDLVTADAVTVATIAYPGTWSTVTTPDDLACRYFDPQPITVPADPATLETVVMAETSDAAYADAVAAATDPSAWDVTDRVELTVDGRDATLVQATATSDAAGAPAGTARYGYLVDLGSAGTVAVWTQGASGEPDYENASALVTLMVTASTFQAPG